MTTQNMIEKAYSTTPTASTISEWDANVNLSANNHIEGFTSTVSSASPITLTVGSPQQQFITGSTAQTFVMPVAATLVEGMSWYIVNQSSAVTTVQSSGGNTIIAMAANTTAVVTCILNSGTTAASWFAEYEQSSLVLPLSLANGGTNAALTASNGGIFYSTASAGAILAGTATAGLVLVSGANSAPSWSTSPATTQVNIQVFTGAGTYTPTTGMTYCIIECIGNGGGGGGVSSSSGIGGAGGGGGGSYSRKVATAATIGSSQSVTFGATGTGGAAGNNNGVSGGDVAVGSICIGKGGSLGHGAPQNSSGAGGAGGIAGTGDVKFVGNAGCPGAGITGTVIAMAVGHGGDGPFGGGAKAAVQANGPAGLNYGAGGAGGTDDSAGGNRSGGAGATGVVIITEFISV